MSVFHHDGIQFCYDVFGEGLPVVFCHGLGADRCQPQELVGPLDGFRLITWDCRGHGSTQPVGPPAKYGFGPMAADLAALLDHLRVERAVVGGISMGAGIAARFAVQWPHRVRSLVLVRPAWVTQPSPEHLALFPRVADMLRRLGPERGLADFQKLSELADLRRQSPAAADSLCEQFVKPDAVQRSVRLERLPADCPIDHWEAVESLAIPGLIVGNESDTIHPMDYARAWAKHLPAAELVQIPSKSESQERHVAEFRRHLNQFLLRVGKQMPAGRPEQQ